MKNIISAFVLVIAACSLCSCATAPQNPPKTVNLTGVITRSGRPVNDFNVRVQGGGSTKTENGYYRLDNVPSGKRRLYIVTKSPGSTPRYYPMVELAKNDETRCYDMVPYYAADHGPFHYDWRLHRSWGNALDNPFDTSSAAGLAENSKTFSGLVMKPVYAVGVVAEAVWLVPSFGVFFAQKALPGKGMGITGISRTLLAGFMTVEAIVKVVEVPVKTILWPIDKLVSWRARRGLRKRRDEILKEKFSRVRKFPSLLAIFLPPWMFKNSPCIQKLKKGFPVAASDWAISLVWWTSIWSVPPQCISS